MKPPSDPTTGAEGSSEKNTGLPWPRSWPGVYLLVVTIFCIWVALLSAFMRAFA